MKKLAILPFLLICSITIMCIINDQQVAHTVNALTAQSAPTISAGNITIQALGAFNISVIINSNNTGYNLTSVHFNLMYDPTKITATGATVGTWGGVLTFSIVSGDITVDVTGVVPVGSSGVIANIAFNGFFSPGPSNVATSPLTLSGASFNGGIAFSPGTNGLYVIAIPIVINNVDTVLDNNTIFNDWINRTVFAPLSVVINNANVIIRGNASLNLQNMNLNLNNGSVIVEGNAVLNMQNTNLAFNRSSDYLTLRNPAAGQPKLIAKKSSIVAQANNMPLNMQNTLASLTNCSTNMLCSITRTYFNVSGILTSIKRVTAFDNSVLRINDTATLKTLTYIDNIRIVNSTLIVSSCRISTARLSDHSILNSSGGAEIDNFQETNSTAYVTKSVMLNATTLGNSNFVASSCANTLNKSYFLQDLSFYNNSIAQVSNSEVRNSISSYDNAQVTGVEISFTGPVSFILSAGNTHVELNSSNCQNIITKGNSTASMNNVTATRLLTYGDVRLSLSHIIIQDWEYTLDNAQIHLSNSILHGALDAQGKSQIAASNCTFEQITGRGSSSISIENSTAYQISGQDSSNIRMINSQLQGLEIKVQGVEGTFTGFTETNLNYWNVEKNNTISNLLSGANIANVTLINMPKPEDLTYWFLKSSNVSIVNARLANVIAQGRSTLTIYNSTVNVLKVQNESMAYTYWNITNIKVVNSQNEAVSGATVKVIDPKLGVLYQGKTDSNGRYTNKTQILASIINGTEIVKSLVIEVSAGSNFIRTLAANLPSGDTTIELHTTIPWWQQNWYYIAAIMVLAALIIFILIRWNRS